MTCRAGDAALLGVGDAAERAAVIAVRAQPHFHDDQYAALARDDVELAQPAAVIAQQDDEALVVQELRGALLGGLADLAAIDEWAWAIVRSGRGWRPGREDEDGSWRGFHIASVPAVATPRSLRY